MRVKEEKKGLCVGFLFPALGRSASSPERHTQSSLQVAENMQLCVRGSKVKELQRVGCLVQYSTMKSTFFGSFWKPNSKWLTDSSELSFGMTGRQHSAWNLSSQGLPQCPWRGTSQNCGP